MIADLTTAFQGIVFGIIITLTFFALAVVLIYRKYQ